MQKPIICWLIAILLFAASVDGRGAVLIFKTSKVVATSEQVELGTIDAAKYRQIRIAIKFGGANSEDIRAVKGIAEIELNSARRNYDRVKEGVESGVYSRSQLDEAQQKIDRAQRDLDNASPTITLYAVESGETVLIEKYDTPKEFRSIVIDSPPSKLSVKVAGKGEYKIFVWAS